VVVVTIFYKIQFNPAFNALKRAVPCRKKKNRINIRSNNAIYTFGLRIPELDPKKAQDINNREHLN